MKYLYFLILYSVCMAAHADAENFFAIKNGSETEITASVNITDISNPVKPIYRIITETLMPGSLHEVNLDNIEIAAGVSIKSISIGDVIIPVSQGLSTCKMSIVFMFDRPSDSIKKWMPIFEIKHTKTGNQHEITCSEKLVAIEE